MTLNEIKKRLTFHNDQNLEFLSDILTQMEGGSELTEEELMELKVMFVKSMCIMNFESDWMNFDITELDCKRYVVDDGEYAGVPFAVTEESLEHWKNIFIRANDGDAAACMFVAQKLSEGYFSQAMTVYASQYWRIAAEHGDVLAMYNYGMCFRWGEYGEWADPDQAMEWFRKAADAGHAEAAELIDRLDSDDGKSILLQSAISGAEGYGTKWYKSKSMAEKYFEGADHGDAEMQYELARQSVPGERFDAFKRKPENAVKYYKMASESGILDAMFNLANLYETGCPGMEPEIEKAFEWRKKCADAGDAEAAYLLAVMYRDGEGTVKDQALCKEYLKKSAGQGFGKAKRMLQEMPA